MTVRSNLVALFIAEEVANSLGSNGTIAPLTGTDIWRGEDPNTFSETGGQIGVVSRNPISRNRQNRKGTVTSLAAQAGFNLDVTKSNMVRYNQGLFYADAREQPATKPIAGGAEIPITGVTATYNAASGLGVFNVANRLVWASGFGVTGNNGLKVVTSATATALTVTPAPSTEAAPPAAAELRVVGHQFASGDLSVTFSGGLLTLTSAASALPTTLTPGQWIFVGGDAANTFFATCPRGWMRLRTVSAGSYVIDLAEMVGGAAPVTDAGTTRTIQIFFGSVQRNETGASIKRRSYQIERQLDTNQNEYIIGAVPNELAVSIPAQDKVTAELSFMAVDHSLVNGAPKAGTRVSPLGEEALNTSSHTKFSKLCLAPNGAGNSTSGNLFAFATDIQVTVNNGNEMSTAVGKIGAIDLHEKNFTVSGSLSAYFQDVAAMSAIRNNSNVGFAACVISQEQAGFIFDIPLLQLGGGMANVEKDADVMVPLDLSGVQNSFGYTASWQTFYYVPAAAAA